MSLGISGLVPDVSEVRTGHRIDYDALLNLMHAATTETEEQRYAELQLLALDFARNGETESLAQMVQHGLPVNLADARGNSLLMLASYHGNIDTCRMLLEAGADADRRNDRGQTPLGGAAFKGSEEIVELLLAHGADIDADNGAGMTPLMFAAVFGRENIVAQLKRHGASLRRRNRIGFSATMIVRVSGLIHRLIACVKRCAR